MFWLQVKFVCSYELKSYITNISFGVELYQKPCPIWPWWHKRPIPTVIGSLDQQFSAIPFSAYRELYKIWLATRLQIFGNSKCCLFENDSTNVIIHSWKKNIKKTFNMYTDIVYVKLTEYWTKLTCLCFDVALWEITLEVRTVR